MQRQPYVNTEACSVLLQPPSHVAGPGSSRGSLAATRAPPVPATQRQRQRLRNPLLLRLNPSNSSIVNNPTTILVSIASLSSTPPALVLRTRLPVYIPNQFPIRHPRSVSERSRHDGRASVAPPPGSAQHRHGMWTPSRMPSCAERVLTIFSQVLGFAASCCGAATCSAVCSACGKCGNRLVTPSPSSRDAWLTIG